MRSNLTLNRVGNPGDTGIIEILDMMITQSGPTAGAVFMEWNTAQEPGQPGSTAMWDTIFRVGGGDVSDSDVHFLLDSFV
jgi:glucan 1,3-beta-glucosidase